jgi:hypothetical protein
MPASNRPGQKVPQSGIWTPTAGGTPIAVSKGDRFPPTKPGTGYVLKVPTKTK